MGLHSNAISHWLGAYAESSLNMRRAIGVVWFLMVCFAFTSEVHILVAKWTTNGGNLGGPVSIEWPIEVMCCAQYLLLLMSYILWWQSGKGLGSPNGPTRCIFRSTSRFIGHLGCLGTLLIYTLVTVSLQSILKTHWQSYNPLVGTV